MSVHGSELERLQQDLTESERQRETLRHLLLGMVERIDADSLISLDEWEKLAETGTKAIHSQQTFLEYLEGDAVPDTYTGLRKQMERLLARRRLAPTLEALRWFLGLRCKEQAGAMREQINQDLDRHRQTVLEWLNGDTAPMEWQEKAMPYRLLRDVHTGQYDSAAGGDPYPEIAQVFGFAISFALKGDYLEWSEPDTHDVRETAAAESGSAPEAGLGSGPKMDPAEPVPVAESGMKAEAAAAAEAAVSVPVSESAAEGMADASDEPAASDDRGAADGTAVDAVAVTDEPTVSIHAPEDAYPAELCLNVTNVRYSLESRAKSGSVSVNKFEKELSEWARLGNAAFVLSFTAQHGFVTRNMLAKDFEESGKSEAFGSYLAILDRIVRRGYFDSHTIEFEGEEDVCYTVSSQGWALLSREGTRQALRKKLKNVPEFASAEWEVPEEPERAAFALLRLRVLFDVLNRTGEHDKDLLIEETNRNVPYRLLKMDNQPVLYVCGDLPAYDPGKTAVDIERLIGTMVQRFDGNLRVLAVTTRPGSYWGERLRKLYGIEAFQVWPDGDGAGFDAEVKDTVLRKVLRLDRETNAVQAGVAEQSAEDAADDAARVSVEESVAEAGAEAAEEPEAAEDAARTAEAPVGAEASETAMEPDISGKSAAATEPDGTEPHGVESDAMTTHRDAAPAAKSEPSEMPAQAASASAKQPVTAKSGQPPKDDIRADESNPDDLRQQEEAVRCAVRLLSDGQMAEGAVLLHALTRDPGLNLSDLDVLRDKVSFSLFDPLYGNRERDRFELLDTPIPAYVPGHETLDDWLSASISVRMFFDPDDPKDYRLRNRWSQINSDQSSAVLQALPSIRELIRYFWQFIARHTVGIKYCTSRTASSQLDDFRALDVCKQQLKELIDTKFPHIVRADFKHNKMRVLVNQLYQSPNGRLWELARRAADMPLQELREACREFTLADLDNWLDDPERAVPDDDLLAEYLQRHWDDIKLGGYKQEPLIGNYFSRMMNWLREAVTPVIRCCALRYRLDSSDIRVPVEPEALAAARSRTLELIDAVMREMESAPATPGEADTTGRQCLIRTLAQIRSMLDEEEARKPERFYAPLLLGGYVELNENMLPVFDQEWLDPKLPAQGVRLWERIMKQHHLPRAQDWDEAAERALRRYDLGLYDRLAAILDRSPIGEEEVRKTADKLPVQLERLKEDFRMHVELAQNFGQLTGIEELYDYLRLSEAGEQHARQTRNAGYYKWFLDELRDRIRSGSDRRMEATRQGLETLRREILQKADPSLGEEEALAEWPILRKIDHMLEERNMTVAEDFIRLAGNENLRDIPMLEVWDSDIYEKFQTQYPLLYNACSRNKKFDLHRVYLQNVRNLLYPNQNNRNTENAERFIKLWHKPKSLDEFMGMLLSQKIREVRPVQYQREYLVCPEPRDARLAQYPHPFAAFGTKAAGQGLRVILMDGNRKPENILDEVASYGKGSGSATIVLLDYALSLADWRVLARSVKLRSMAGEIVAVVDRVLTLFLAGYPEHERVRAFLMAALPASKVQPFAPSGYGPIPPEMFIGRATELEKIQQMDGPVFVYGGRQLGKTVLLRETENRLHDPEKGCYAIYIDIKRLDAKQALTKICGELVRKKSLAKSCETWEQFQEMLRDRLTREEEPIEKLLLLLDEADAFLEDCEKLENRPLEFLQDLRIMVPGKFKFVLAGLHNVVRFNQKLLRDNSVLGHLYGINIGPMKYLDARELLLRPLHYLGFRLERDSEALISFILAKTNYYPGMIHYFGEQLIETIAESYRKGVFNQNSAPPYILGEGHIKTLLGQKNFRDEVEKRFRITLQLDTEYDILAKAMAVHYYMQGIGHGATAKELYEICQVFGLEKISSLPIESVQALMEEMAALNIFSPEASGSDRYVFSRYSFFEMQGDEERLEIELERMANMNTDGAEA